MQPDLRSQSVPVASRLLWPSDEAEQARSPRSNIFRPSVPDGSSYQDVGLQAAKRDPVA